MTITRARALRYAAIPVVVVILAIVPSLNGSVGGLLPGAVNSPGSLQLISLMLVAAATAVTLDLIYGYTGMLSFGHALYFGIGCYSTVLIANTDRFGFGLAVVLAVLLTMVVAVIGNAASLRLTGIGFSMTTLAVAQLLAIGVERGYFGSGGEVGVTYATDTLPSTFVGIVNTKHSYWLALGLLVVVYAFSAFLVRTEVGHVWQAIRENALRTRVLGYNVYRYQLGAGIVGSTLAGLCGVVYSVVMGGANPSIVNLNYSLGFVLMVVLGGSGRLWGAVIGGLIYTYLNLRLNALSSSGFIADLPDVFRVPLSQPNFILGVVFVLVILFMPGGLVQAIERLFSRRSSVEEPPAPAPVDQEGPAERDLAHR